MDNQAAARPGSNPDSDDAGWVRVLPKARRHPRPFHHAHPGPAPLTALSPSPSASSTGAGSRSVSDIDAEYRAIRSEWERSPCCLALRQLMANNALVPGTVSQAICLGIGSFDPSDGAWEAKRRTYVQFIAFLVMIQELEKYTAHKIPCVFQEPLFSESDKAFIVGLGHRVVESQRGCHMVDESSLVFGIHLYRPVYALALKGAAPAIFAGTGWDVWDSVSLTEAQDNNLVHMQEMERTYIKSTFPQDVLGTAFSSTSIYWRPCPHHPPDLTSK